MIYAFFSFFCSKIIFDQNKFLLAEINLTTWGPLYTCLVYILIYIFWVGWCISLSLKYCIFPYGWCSLIFLIVNFVDQVLLLRLWQMTKQILYYHIHQKLLSCLDNLVMALEIFSKSTTFSFCLNMTLNLTLYCVLKNSPLRIMELGIKWDWAFL